MMIAFLFLVSFASCYSALDNVSGDSFPKLNLKNDAIASGAYNKYNGTLITPKSAVQLSESMPKALQNIVDSWFEQEENSALVKELARTPNPFNADTFREKRNADKKKLAQLEEEGKLVTLSRYNSVLAIKHLGTRFIIKVCGESAKIEVLLRDAGIDLDEEAKKFPNGNISLSKCDFDYSKIDPERITYFNVGRIVQS